MRQNGYSERSKYEESVPVFGRNRDYVGFQFELGTVEHGQEALDSVVFLDSERRRHGRVAFLIRISGGRFIGSEGVGRIFPRVVFLAV